jgi:hypothetical protein
MKNIVRFKINHCKPIIIKHNDIDVIGKEVECIKGTNTFTIEGSDFQVNDVSMFNLGEGELTRYGIVSGNKWILEYEYPVFSWLHNVLKHGWLLKEDNEQDTHSETGS